MGEESGGGRSLDALLREVARSPDVAPREDFVGKTLGRYRVDALLGRGGMGVVYRAHDTALGRDVALKLLPPELVGDVERRARFVREAKLAAAVAHPCTAAVYDVGESDKHVFLAMELVRGETLRATLEQHAGGMPATDVARIGADVARGLAKAHESGVVHRDLKPENVMIDDEGQLKILDFGLAKLRDVEGEPSTLSTELGRVMGTPSYMSPEQAKGKLVDGRSDIFSLGVVLYELLTGRRPFVGETTMEVLIAIDRDAPAPIAKLRPDVPRTLAAIVDRCLAKDPDERWPSARQLGDALRALPTDGSSRGARRFALRAAAVAAITIVVFVAVRARHGASSGATPTQSRADTLLASENAVLACPPLEGVTTDGPAPWLGAATASLVCGRARWMLGGRMESTLVPAELLGFARAPSEDTPVDAYGEPGARDRAIVAARARGTAFVDGRVELTGESFVADLVLRGNDGAELAHGHGAARSLLKAITAAMQPLHVPQKPLDPSIARWLPTHDTSLALTLADCDWSFTYQTPEECAALEPHAAELGRAWPRLRVVAARNFMQPPLDLNAAPLDRSSPEALLETVISRKEIAGDVDRAVADELEALAAKETTPYGRARLRLGAAQVRTGAGELGANREPLFALVQERPREPLAWDLLGGSTWGLPGFVPVARTHALWVPENPDAWAAIGYSSPTSDPNHLAMLKRAVMLAPDFPLFSSNYVIALLKAGKPAAARAIAVRLVQRGPPQRPVGEAMLVGVEAGSARFGAALERARNWIEEASELGAVPSGAHLFVLRSFDVERLVRRATTLADRAVERFVLAEPPRLAQSHMAAPTALLVCAAARPEIAKPCVAKVKQLLDAKWFREGSELQTKALLEGIEQMLAGNVAAAARAFRTIATSAFFQFGPWLVDVFDLAGDADTADAIDASSLTAVFNGVSSAHVRVARRAAKRGDAKRARELAQAVVDAWAVADVDVAALHEMRDLVAKLPR